MPINRGLSPITPPTSMKLESLDKHLRLIDSYKKLHAARARAAGL